MSRPDHALVEALRDRLHDANDELSIATMQLELLLEAGSLDTSATRSVRDTLDACQAATSALRDAWLVLGQACQG
jgi:hypothetical protein